MLTIPRLPVAPLISLSSPGAVNSVLVEFPDASSNLLLEAASNNRGGYFLFEILRQLSTAVRW